MNIQTQEYNLQALLLPRDHSKKFFIFVISIDFVLYINFQM